MTDDPTLLTRARALLAAITPGEWHRHGREKGSIGGTGVSSDECLIYRVAFDPGCLADTARRQEADAAFIATAPALVRQLVARVEALESALLRIADGEVEVAGLHLQFYGHGMTIARKALALPVHEADYEKARALVPPDEGA